MSKSTKTVYITLTGTILADTGKAIKIQISKVSDTELTHPRTEWIPVSQCSKMFKNPNAVGEDWIMVAEWVCQSKELI